MMKNLKLAIVGLGVAAAGVAGVGTAFAASASEPARAAVQTAGTEAPGASEAPGAPEAPGVSDGPGGYADAGNANVDTQQQGEH